MRGQSRTPESAATISTPRGTLCATVLYGYTFAFVISEILESAVEEMEAGIVGLPNVGKSTLFNALTAAGIASENYPFCTIEPNVGAVAIPDPRLTAINKHIKTEKIIPAIFQLVDIAGLVRGASQGRRARATSSSAICAMSMRSCTSSAATRTKTSYTSKAVSIRFAISKRSIPS